MTKEFICLNKPPENGTVYFTFDLFGSKKVLKYTWSGSGTDYDFLHKSMCFLTKKDAQRAKKFLFKYIKTYPEHFKSLTEEPFNKVVWILDIDYWSRSNIVVSAIYDSTSVTLKFKFKHGLVFKTREDAYRALDLIAETLAAHSGKHRSKLIKYFYGLNKVENFQSKEPLPSNESFNFLIEFPEPGTRVFVADPTNRVGYTSFIHFIKTDSLSDRNILSFRDFLLRSGLLYLTKADAIRASNAMRKHINPDALNFYSLPY